MKKIQEIPMSSFVTFENRSNQRSLASDEMQTNQASAQHGKGTAGMHSKQKREALVAPRDQLGSVALPSHPVLTTHTSGKAMWICDKGNSAEASSGRGTSGRLQPPFDDVCQHDDGLSPSVFLCKGLGQEKHVFHRLFKRYRHLFKSELQQVRDGVQASEARRNKMSFWFTVQLFTGDSRTGKTFHRDAGGSHRIISHLVARKMAKVHRTLFAAAVVFSKDIDGRARTKMKALDHDRGAAWLVDKST